MQDTLASMFEFNRWADERLLTACGQLSDEQYTREIGGSFASIRATVAHHAGALWGWASRFEGRALMALPTAAEVPDVATALRLIAEAHGTLVREATRSAEEQHQIFTFRRMNGQIVSLPRWAALRHVVNHGTYHRGQIANMMRQVGAAPPSTDVLLWAIEQHAAEQTAAEQPAAPQV
jgi:uncharacterized damage-inducible protein DinB